MSDRTKANPNVDEDLLQSEKKFSELSSVLLSPDKPEKKLSHEECLVLIENMRALTIMQSEDILYLKAYLELSNSDIDSLYMELESQQQYIKEIYEKLDRYIIDLYNTPEFSPEELEKHLNYRKYREVFVRRS